jgi:hypothetical protein
MPKKPSPEALEAESIPLRPLIRRALKTAGRPLTVDALFAQLRRIDPTASREAVEEALAYNHRKGMANFEHDHELELDVWSLTTRGKQAV